MHVFLRELLVAPEGLLMETDRAQASGGIHVEGRFPYDGAGQLFRGKTSVGDPVLLSVVPASMATRTVAAAGMQPLDLGTLASGDVYLAFGIPSGETLAQRLARGAMGWVDACRSLLPAVEAIASLHRSGEMYQELAPNLMVFRTDGNLTLVGRELRQLARAVDRRRVAMPAMDAVPYLSPERTRGEAPTRASDVFSLGAILHEAITGFRPFDARDLFELLHQIQTAQVPELLKFDPGIPVALSDMVGAALRKDPERRPDIDAVLTVLRVAVEQAIVEAAVRTEPEVLSVPAAPGEPLPAPASSPDLAKLVADLKAAFALQSPPPLPKEPIQTQPAPVSVSTDPASVITSMPSQVIEASSPLPPSERRALLLARWHAARSSTRRWVTTRALPAARHAAVSLWVSARSGLPSAKSLLAAAKSLSASTRSLWAFSASLWSSTKKGLAKRDPRTLLGVAAMIAAILVLITAGAIASTLKQSKTRRAPAVATVPAQAPAAPPAIAPVEAPRADPLSGLAITPLPTIPRSHRVRPAAARASSPRVAENRPAVAPERHINVQRSAADAAFDSAIDTSDEAAVSLERRHPVKPVNN
jgi:hypothetical protein